MPTMMQKENMYADLRKINIDAQALEAIPAKIAYYYKLMPVECTDSAITVAMVDPSDIQTIDYLTHALKKEIRVVSSSEEEVVAAIKKYYGLGAVVLEGLLEQDTKRYEEERLVSNFEVHDVAGSSEDNTVIKFVNRLFLEAYNDRATDIHLEPYQDEMQVKYRVDGILYEVKIPENTRKIHNAVISRLKIMSNLNIAERRLPQDGRTRITIEGKETDVRISLLPTPFGEAAVIRLLPTNNLFDLENLGLLEDDLAKLEKLIRHPYGIIFATGPTGSGKSTTLYATLNRIKGKEKKIITIEDPIEYQIKGAVQMQVHPAIDFTFAKALPHMLRHDPDVIMVGEVRDQDTAEITIRVALTGHLVFSTLHTNDAASGIIRLIDMGIDPYLVSSAVNAFVAQRLVRVVCDNCKEKAELNNGIFAELDLFPDDVFGSEIFKGKGCDSCGHTGYKGRTAIYEILTVNDEIRDHILKKSPSEVIKKVAVRQGMRTLRRHGWEKIIRGITTPSEVLRVTN